MDLSSASLCSLYCTGKGITGKDFRFWLSKDELSPSPSSEQSMEAKEAKAERKRKRLEKAGRKGEKLPKTPKLPKCFKYEDLDYLEPKVKGVNRARVRI